MNDFPQEDWKRRQEYEDKYPKIKADHAFQEAKARGDFLGAKARAEILITPYFPPTKAAKHRKQKRWMRKTYEEIMQL